jgi:hypothetical protein
VYRAYLFDSWLRYLMEQALIRQDGSVVQITIRGKDFPEVSDSDGQIGEWQVLLGRCEFLEFQVVRIQHSHDGVAKQKWVLAIVETPSHFIEVGAGGPA